MSLRPHPSFLPARPGDHPARPALRRVLVGGAVGLLLTPLCMSSAVAEPTPPEPELHRHLAIGGFGTPLLSMVRVTRDGDMSLEPGSHMPTGLASLGIAITPDARTLYSVHAGSMSIVGYRIGAGGTLSLMTEATVVVGSPVIGAAISPDGSRLFVTTGPSLEPGALGAPGAVLSFAISSTGGLTRTGAPAAPIEGSVSQVAVTPDGRHLVVTSYLTDTVTSFAIGAGSRLTQAGNPVGAGKMPVMPVFTPDGRFVYVSNEGSGDMSGYAVGSDGRLTPTPGSPYDAGQEPHGAVATSDSRRLYAPDATGAAILGWNIGPAGELAPIADSPWPTPGLAGRTVISPDDKRMYQIQAIATDNAALHSYVHGYRFDEQGRPVSEGDPVDTGIVFHDGVTAYFTPNQGPVARVELVGRSGASRTFSAAASSDSDGRVARYEWTFGDGTTAVTSSPEVTHAYRGNGPWQASMVVTDDENCSTSQVFQGVTVLCRGGDAARAKITVW
jgi:6-phosphogluconolactonase